MRRNSQLYTNQQSLNMDPCAFVFSRVVSHHDWQSNIDQCCSVGVHTGSLHSNAVGVPIRATQSKETSSSPCDASLVTCDLSTQLHSPHPSTSTSSTSHSFAQLLLAIQIHCQLTEPLRSSSFLAVRTQNDGARRSSC